MTRIFPCFVALMTLGGDQRERDREKAQKKAAQAAKGKSNSAKEKEAYPALCARQLILPRHAEIMRQKQKAADEKKAAEAAAKAKK